MPRPVRTLVSRDYAKSRRIEVGYTTDKVILRISRKTQLTGGNVDTYIQFILEPEDVSELLEMLVWADSSREIAANTLKAEGQAYY